VVSLLRSRLAALASAVMIALILGFGAHVRGSLAAAWQLFRIPASTPDFADVRIITHAIDCVANGQDPYTACSLDPWERIYNYPPLWLKLGNFGVSSRSTDLIGIAFAGITVAAVVTLFSARSWVSGIFAFSAMWSWPLLFGIERGNTDTFIFSVSVLALLGMHRMNARHEQLARELLIVALAVLKLYPIAMSLLFIRGSKGWRRAGIVFTAAALAVFTTCLHRLHSVFVNTPTDHWLSFGSFDTFRSVRPYLPSVLGGHLGDTTRMVATLGSAVAGAIAMAYGSMNPPPVTKFLTRFDANTGIGAVASTGLAVFWLTYVMGSNYDYRLIFLLGPLGFLVRDIDRSGSLRSVPLILLLLGDQFSLYAPRAAFAHALHPIVFVVACAWLGHAMLALDTPEPAAGAPDRITG